MDTVILVSLVILLVLIVLVFPFIVGIASCIAEARDQRAQEVLEQERTRLREEREAKQEAVKQRRLDVALHDLELELEKRAIAREQALRVPWTSKTRRWWNR